MPGLYARLSGRAKGGSRSTIQRGKDHNGCPINDVQRVLYQSFIEEHITATLALQRIASSGPEPACCNSAIRRVL
jgi:hypothetical protein